MMELNGKTYEMQYLTDEETAVINAMRRGAKVQASFFFSTDEAVKEHAKQLSLETFPKGGPSDLGDGLTAYHFKSDRVDIVHFVQN